MKIILTPTQEMQAQFVRKQTSFATVQEMLVFWIGERYRKLGGK